VLRKHHKVQQKNATAELQKSATHFFKNVIFVSWEKTLDYSYQQKLTYGKDWERT